MAYALIQDRRNAVNKWRKKYPDLVAKQKERYRKKHGKKLIMKMRKWRKEHKALLKVYKEREKKKLERFVFKVIVKEIPKKWLIRDMKAYIQSAIQYWRKSGDPESELFNMEETNFIVKQIRPKK